MISVNGLNEAAFTSAVNAFLKNVQTENVVDAISMTIATYMSLLFEENNPYDDNRISFVVHGLRREQRLSFATLNSEEGEMYKVAADLIERAAFTNHNPDGKEFPSREPTTLEKAIGRAINIHGADSKIDTPDFILAEYLGKCLSAFDAANKAREGWYGRKDSSPPATATDEGGSL